MNVKLFIVLIVFIMKINFCFRFIKSMLFCERGISGFFLELGLGCTCGWGVLGMG